MSDKELAAKLALKFKSREIIWENFFKRCENESKEDVSFPVNLIPKNLYFDDDSLDYTNKVSVKNLTTHQQKIVNKIEIELKSYLHELILQREKTKILRDLEEYDIIHSKTKDEIGRLREFLNVEDIETYIGLCIFPKAEIDYIIEKIVRSDLKHLLINQLRASNKLELMRWNNKLLIEWDYLTKVLTEEDVIVYAVSWGRKHNF